MDKLVFSRTLQRADWGKVAIIRDNIAATRSPKRKAEPGKDMVLIAGAGIATTFLTLELVDELLPPRHAPPRSAVARGSSRPVIRRPRSGLAEGFDLRYRRRSPDLPAGLEDSPIGGTRALQAERR